MDPLIFGDPHGSLPRICRYVLSHRPKAVLLLGDLELSAPLDVEAAPILDAVLIGFYYSRRP